MKKLKTYDSGASHTDRGLYCNISYQSRDYSLVLSTLNLTFILILKTT